MPKKWHRFPIPIRYHNKQALAELVTFTQNGEENPPYQYIVMDLETPSEPRI